jgi:hypothetical protein
MLQMERSSGMTVIMPTSPGGMASVPAARAALAAAVEAILRASSPGVRLLRSSVCGMCATASRIAFATREWILEAIPPSGSSSGMVRR